MFKGLYTALVTPFTDDDAIDYAALEELLKQQVDAAIDGLVILGTTGESATIKYQERKELIRFVINKLKNKTQVIIGAGTNSTEDTIHLAKEAETLGANGLLLVTPYYSKPTQLGLYEHFKRVAQSVGIPIMLYNIQGRSGVNIETNTIKRLAEIENICSIKESSGSILQLMDIIEAVSSDDFTVLMGEDMLMYPAMALGAMGGVSVISNVLPKQMKQLVDYSFAKDYNQAKKIHYQLLSLMNTLFIETNPIPVKTVLAWQHKIKENFRLPLCNMSLPNKEVLRAVFGKFI